MSLKDKKYRSQLFYLRLMAKEALKNYPISVQKVEFIHHGENTTFRTYSKNKSYLLRLHRNDYHTKEAILEEMKWIKQLSLKNLKVPQPIFSKHKNLVETVKLKNLNESRNCSVFNWINGRLISKSFTQDHLFKIGQLLGHLHNNKPKIKNYHRKYWTPEGLLGEKPKFGNIDHLHSTTKMQQKIITGLRKKTLRKLVNFKNNYPKKFGYIHADLHFGNVILNKSNLYAIDFDDCGIGFFAYDLVTPYLSLVNSLGKKNKNLLEKYKKSLTNGYASIRSWDSVDDKIFQQLIIARKVAMLGWLNSRSEIPRLKKYLKVAVKNLVTDYKS